MNGQLTMDSGKSVGTVECFGITFPSEDARRTHFLALLSEKLKDPAFRNQEGFPEGTDDAILAMSDPPYYTACPNPWIADFVRFHGSEYDPNAPYSRVPYASDVMEGKNHPIYNAHSYHTKVPHRAIMRYILHFTDPGDLVLDGFAGTGMAGVAALMCGNRSEVESLGLEVLSDRSIRDIGRSTYKSETDLKFGRRYSVLGDLSPAATFIAHNYNADIDTVELTRVADRIIHQLKKEFSWLWTTNVGTQRGWINYTVWSEVFACSECAGEINYYENAFRNTSTGVEYNDVFPCPHCGSLCSKNPSKKSGANALERVFVTFNDPFLGTTLKQQKRVPVLINYSIGKKRYTKKIDDDDFNLLLKISDLPISRFVPTDRMPEGDEARRNDDEGITHVHHFYSRRILETIGRFRDLAKGDHCLEFLLGSVLPKLTIMNRFMPQHGGRALVGPMANTLYVPPVSVENNAIDQLEFQLKKIVSALNDQRSSCISTQGMQNWSIPENSIDYIFLDPPFGANIMYSELSFLRESWLGVKTNIKLEAIENKTQKKGPDEYRRQMSRSFKEAYRVLKPGRWITVEFSNTKASVWNSIQIALSEAGFVIASVAALDKTRGGLHSMIGVTAVKQDLIISAYKPNDALEARLQKQRGSEESIWDFVHTHLQQVVVVRSNARTLEFIVERDPRIIFDRVVSWFVQHNYPVPVSSQEFQEGLRQKFIERDGMIFLPDQVVEYDKKRAQFNASPQIELFVSDEKSAIDWLSDHLKKRPSTYQELQPDFFGQLGAGWKKHEERPELAALLDENFLRFDGNGEVPNQIHRYLSSNFKDLRGLEKNDERLKQKAKDRWYVPDPNKAKDLEQKRERSLLKEFESYRSAPGRRIKEFRLEVLRAGFKTAWAAKDYRTIIGIAQKIPEEALQEDEKLLLWYDQALTRMEADA